MSMYMYMWCSILLVSRVACIDRGDAMCMYVHVHVHRNQLAPSYHHTTNTTLFFVGFFLLYKRFGRRRRVECIYMYMYMGLVADDNAIDVMCFNWGGGTHTINARG